MRGGWFSAKVVRLVVVLSGALAVFSPLPGLSLLERSPFIGPDFEARAEPVKQREEAETPKELEFHAVYRLGGQTHILLSERRGQNFRWLAVGEGRDGLEARSYDPESNTVRVWRNGEELVLTLQDLPEWQPNRNAASLAARRRVANANAGQQATTSNDKPRRRIQPVRDRGQQTVRRPENRRRTGGGEEGDGEESARRRAAMQVMKPDFVPEEPQLKDPPSDPPAFVPEEP